MQPDSSEVHIKLHIAPTEKTKVVTKTTETTTTTITVRSSHSGGTSFNAHLS